MGNQEIIEQTIAKYEQFINPAVARLFRFMGLATVEWEGRGSVIYDINGKEYLDCLGGYGVFNLGHSHPQVIAAVEEQLARMPLSGKILFNKTTADLAEALAKITPGDLQYSFFTNSGTESVEGSLKLARIHTGRQKIISTRNSFHGKSFGALSATGREIFRQAFEPLLPGISHVPFDDIAALEAVVDENTAAVILEPIQGEGGIIVPQAGYLSAVRRICDNTGALLICDEVQTGMGRTGKMFAVEHEGIVPDILATAKALGGGVMPIGAFTARPKVWDKYIESPFLHTTTFGGNPLACAAALGAIRAIEEEGLVERAAQMGGYFKAGLEKLGAAYPEVVREVRGQGLMLGVELAKEGIGGLLMSSLIDQGIIVAYTLNNPKVIRLEPPLIITQEQIDFALGAFKKALALAQDMLEDL
ncbi:MAG: aminotransferase class III-fold pyridoxal phosphate-dependent enzyme [Sporomusaceae bacterium]|jgi:putrescine aminotransferase|nr:aminotransferase class III-fold pyridoxal phosphate-dependent enzyme [Sporomusaceae bacterium]